MNRYFANAGLAIDYRNVQLQKRNTAFEDVELHENRHGYFWVPAKKRRKAKKQADADWSSRNQ